MELAGGDAPLHLHVRCAEAAGVGDHAHPIARHGLGAQALGIGEVETHGDLGQHVLAGGDGRAGLLGMQRAGAGEDHGVDVVAREARSEILRVLGDAPLGGEGRGVGGHAAGDTDHLGTADLVQGLQVDAGDGAFTSDQDTDGSGSRHRRLLG
ncbi:hypothetical protein D3C81_1506770 [compost metagenome]